MNHSESIKNITVAIAQVMATVGEIEKGMTVGTGQNSYKGVSDESVKKTIGAAMIESGLVMIPTDVQSKTTIERWEENGRTRQLVLDEVHTKYLLAHISGEWIEVAGHGHGTDSQDKAAGKATTYALKYALLYTFMVATSKIDDTDTDHSDNNPVPAKDQPAKPWLNTGTPEWEKAANLMAKSTDKAAAVKSLRNHYAISKEIAAKLLAL